MWPALCGKKGHSLPAGLHSGTQVGLSLLTNHGDLSDEDSLQLKAQKNVLCFVAITPMIAFLPASLSFLWLHASYNKGVLNTDSGA